MSCPLRGFQMRNVLVGGQEGIHVEIEISLCRRSDSWDSDFGS
jgi:hypothetical protein